MDKVPFCPYFYIKDLFSVVLLSIMFSLFVFFAPNELGHWMAVFVRERNYYDIAICFKDWLDALRRPSLLGGRPLRGRTKGEGIFDPLPTY